MQLGLRAPRLASSGRTAGRFVLLLAIGAAESGCATCTEHGCSSAISVKLIGEPPGMDKRVSACLAYACAEVSWPYTSGGCESAEDPRLNLTVCAREGDGIMINLVFGPELDARDSAPFELAIEDGSGIVVFQKSELVRFSHSYPNGADCPGHCRYANYRY